MWQLLPPAAYTSLVGARCQERKGSQVSVALERRPPLASLLLLQELRLTSGTRLGPREGKTDSCWDTALSQAWQTVRPLAGTHATSPAFLIPKVQRLLQCQAICYSRTVRSKVTVELVAGRGCSRELCKLLSAFCPASHSDLVFLFFIHEGELLVWLPWGSGLGPV